MELQYVDVKDVVIPRYHRAIKPWVLEQIKRSMQDHDYNIAYPITLDGKKALVDGRHRLEAAKELGIPRVPWVKKPDGVSPIRFALQCNADGQLCAPDDVFDLAELCYGLSQDGWSGQQIAGELGGWSDSAVEFYRQIKAKLHPRAWELARSPTKIGELWEGERDDIVGLIPTNVSWLESHFRALLKHLPCNNGDRGAMRAQMAVIRHALKRWETNKVTARWIEEAAMRHA